MTDAEIILERETANDESASVVAVHAPSGTRVASDDPIFDIENSKATQELRAPVAGILIHDLAVGQAVGFGVPIARITTAEPDAEIFRPAPPHEPAAPLSLLTGNRKSEARDELAISLPRETANDEAAALVAVHHASGSAVQAGTLLFELENSKATQEVEAPASGTLLHDLVVGQMVGFGVTIARIVPADVEKPALPGQAVVRDGEVVQAPPTQTALPPAEAAERAGMAPPRFSRAAAALIAEHRMDPEGFTLGFVTGHDVRQRLGHRTEASHKPMPAADQPARIPSGFESPGEIVGHRKRVEIEALSHGAGGSMLSVLGVTVGQLTIRRSADAFLDGRITDLVIYEASRLMRKYPRLNAAYADGRVFLHTAVHAGLAIDTGGRLVVYGIENADRVALSGLPDVIADAVARYLDNALTGAELSRATFTITDLSADELDFVFPLLPRGQTCILGITRSERDGFRVFAGFDHRVTEGHEVAAFLGDLRARLLSFGSSQNADGATARCAYCDRSATEAVATSRDKGLLKVVDHHGREALCCASCWNGW